VHFAQRAAHHREVLREDIDQPPADRPPAGDDAIGKELLVRLVHAEIALAVHHKSVHLAEAARIEQQVEPLAGSQLAGLMLFLDAIRAAARCALQPHLVELLNLRIRCRHQAHFPRFAHSVRC